MFEIVARAISIATIYAAVGCMLFAAAYDLWRDPMRCSWWVS